VMLNCVSLSLVTLWDESCVAVCSLCCGSWAVVVVVVVVVEV